jgi:AcrR family transcriptional regulator
LSTRERIVDAAEQVLRTKGYARATTKEIARAAGVSEGTLYNHFESKEDLWLNLLGQQLPGFFALIRSLPERAGTGNVRDNLGDVAGSALTFYIHVVPMGAAVLAEPELLARLREAVVSRQAGPHKANEFLASYFRAEQDLGRLRADANPEAAAYLLLGACFQKAHWLQFLGETVSQEEVARFARQIVDTLMRGLGLGSGDGEESVEGHGTHPSPGAF